MYSSVASGALRPRRPQSISWVLSRSNIVFLFFLVSLWAEEEINRKTSALREKKNWLIEIYVKVDCPTKKKSMGDWFWLREIIG